MDFPILLTLLAAPAVAMVIVMVLRDSAQGLIRVVSLAGTLLSLLLSACLWLHFDRAQPGFQWAERYGAVEGWGMELALAADGLTIPLLVLTSLIIVTGLLVARSVTTRIKEYHVLLLFLVTGAYGVLLAVDLFFFFLFYEVAVIPMFLLVNVWGSGNKEYAANKLTLYLLAGSGLVLFGFFVLFFASGLNSFDLQAMLESKVAIDPGIQKWLFLLFLIGFGTLAAMWPFHTWSPDGYASAPTSASMLHAAVLKTIGAYGLLRVAVPLLPDGAAHWQPLMLGLGVTNVLYAALCVISQRDLKYVIGYSCVSHMGIVMLGVGCLTAQGVTAALFQMFAHGIMTALLFATGGYIYEARHTRRLDELGGLFRTHPRAALLFAVGAFACLGLPGLSGFVAEFMVLYAVFTVSPIVGCLALPGLVLSAIYMLRVLKSAFWGAAASTGHPGRDMTLLDALPGFCLAAFLIVLGFYPQIFLRAVQSTSVWILTLGGGI